jgi:hypothetical protein
MAWDYGYIGAWPSGHNFIFLGYLAIRKGNNNIGWMHFETFRSTWALSILLHYSLNGPNIAIIEAQFVNLIPEQHNHNILGKSSSLRKRAIPDRMVSVYSSKRVLNVRPLHRVSILLEVRNCHWYGMGQCWHDIKRIITKVSILFRR